MRNTRVLHHLSAVLVLMSHLFAQSVTFSPHQDFATGRGPSSAAAADFNKDGNIDIAVANSNDNTVVILLGKGDGTFQAGATLPVQNMPISIAAGDLNNDGNIDIVVSNNGSNSLSVLLGRGDGTFQPTVNMPTSRAFPRSVVLADFNRDGKLDVALSSGLLTNGTAYVEVRLGNGDGTFRTAGTYPVGANLNTVVTADLNADGLPDLVVLDLAGNAAAILLGDGTGQFKPATPVALGSGPTSLVVVDLNGDGKPDLVACNNMQGSLSVALGKGGGVFAAAATISLAPTGINPVTLAAADFDGDGRPDIAAVDPAGAAVVTLGKGDGTFQLPERLAVGGRPLTLLAVDLNHDGAPDLVVLSLATNTLSVLLNTTAPPSRFLGRWRDQNFDIISVSQSGSSVSLQYSNGRTATGIAQSALALQVNFGPGCCTGAVSPDGTRIDWSNGTAWYRPYLGVWTYMNTVSNTITQSGSAVTIQDSNGGSVHGTAQGDSILNIAFSPGCCTGTVSPDGKRITWSNGTFWAFASLAIPSTDHNIITTVAGNGQAGFSGDEQAATAASLNGPRAISVDSEGNLVIADTKNQRVRRMSPDGTITTIAGNGTAGFSGDGGPATLASLNQPVGVFAAANGNLYISDSGNLRIRVVTTDGIINTVAGNGTRGFAGDGGDAVSAMFESPVNIVGDAQGSIYVVDYGNSRIRKITPDGKIRTVAGAGPNGPVIGAVGQPIHDATAVNIGSVTGLAIDAANNLYFSTGYQHPAKLAPDGTLTLLAVTTTTGASVAVDPVGDLFIGMVALFVGETGGDKIVELTPAGSLSTIAGTGAGGFSGDGGPAAEAAINFASDLGTDAEGSLFIADTNNNRIRKITFPPVLTPAGVANAASIVAGPIAPDEFVSIFGAGFSRQVTGAQVLPLPNSLAGITVKIKDSSGNELPAALQLVLPTQINCVVPSGLQPGPAIVTLTRPDGQVSSTQVQVASVAPGVFTANASGRGVPSAIALRVTAEGAQIQEPVFQCGGNGCVPSPIDMGQDTDQTFLVLAATGFRGAALSDIQANIGGVPAEVVYAGPQGTYPGLDQLNIRIPQELRGRGSLDVILTVAGQKANTVTVSTQ